MLKKLSRCGLFALAWLLPMACALARTPFSADTVQTIPGGPAIQGKVYVGAEAMRMEQEVNGRKMIQIFIPGQGLTWMLDPQQKIYHEIRGTPIPVGSVPSDPCVAMPGFHCRKAGVEMVSGRKAEKWEFTGTVQGKTVNGAVWLDVERHTPLRQQGADGAVMEMKLLGSENLNGRNTEKWEVNLRSADGRSQRATQWYDPELAYTVREELPGGMTNELRNIRVGPPPAELFRLPTGYQKRELPVPLPPLPPPAAGTMGAPAPATGAAAGR